MSQTVLYDIPGPRARRRHLIYTVLTLIVLAGVVYTVISRLAAEDQFAFAKWEPFVTPRYLEALLVDGVLTTLRIAFFAVVLSVVLGLVLGTAKLSDHGWVSWPAWAVVEFFRAVPLLLLIVFIYFAVGIGDGIGAFWSLVIGLTLYNGSVLAEIFRAGINAVPAGQVEAAYALGLRKTQVMVIVQLPQAVKIMLPAIISQCVVALKDTSLGYAISAPGLTFIGEGIYTSSQNFQNQLPVAIVLAGIYIVLNLVLTAVATAVQRRIIKDGNTPVAVTGGPAAGDDATEVRL